MDTLQKIPAMEDPSRSGYDGTNENVHNYFINIMARGGLLHLIIISIMYYLFLKKVLQKVISITLSCS